MIVHSTRNTLGAECVVQVEDAHGETEDAICRFAEGAAAKHNAGWRIARSVVDGWLDDAGCPLRADEDTSGAGGAIVSCTVEEVPDERVV